MLRSIQKLLHTPVDSELPEIQQSALGYDAGRKTDLRIMSKYKLKNFRNSGNQTITRTFLKFKNFQNLQPGETPGSYFGYPSTPMVPIVPDIGMFRKFQSGILRSSMQLQKFPTYRVWEFYSANFEVIRLRSRITVKILVFCEIRIDISEVLEVLEFRNIRHFLKCIQSRE